MRIFTFIHGCNSSPSSWPLGIVLQLLSLLHIMHTRVLGPAAHSLAIVIEDDSAGAPEEDQAHVQHDRGDISGRDDPGGDEFAEAVTPEVLVDRDGHKNATRDGLVRVDRVRGRDCRDRRHLDTRACISDDHNDLPGCVSQDPSVQGSGAKQGGKEVVME